MKFATAQQILSEKEPPKLYDVVEPALGDGELRQFLVEGSLQKNETLRYNCVRVMLRALAREPRLFYEYWDRFAGMIASPNGFYRSSSAQAIAYLVSVDRDCRLDPLLHDYLGLLDDSKVMVSHYFLETLDRLYRARADLRTKLIATLLGIDRTRHSTQRRDMLKADILQVFERLFDILPPEDRVRAITFAEAALGSSSPKTRKAAKIFIARHPH